MKLSKNIIRLLLATTSAFSLALSALGYGPQGHETVGAIADELIRGTSAETHVKALLGPAETLLGGMLPLACSKCARGKHF